MLLLLNPDSCPLDFFSELQRPFGLLVWISLSECQPPLTESRVPSSALSQACSPGDLRSSVSPAPSSYWEFLSRASFPLSSLSPAFTLLRAQNVRIFCVFTLPCCLLSCQVQGAGTADGGQRTGRRLTHLAASPGLGAPVSLSPELLPLGPFRPTDSHPWGLPTLALHHFLLILLTHLPVK